MKKTLLIASGAFMIAASTISLAEDTKPDPSIAYRHHAMELTKDSLISMFGIAKGKVPASELVIHMNVMAASAASAQAAFSKKAPGGKTLDSAWENWEDFSKRMDKYVADTAAFAATADKDDATQNAAFKQVLSNCKACHDKYRQEMKRH